MATKATLKLRRADKVEGVRRFSALPRADARTPEESGREGGIRAQRSGKVRHWTREQARLMARKGGRAAGGRRSGVRRSRGLGDLVGAA